MQTLENTPLLPAVILAGGRGTRMGGLDKALLTIAGRPLVAHVIGRLSPQCGPLAINAGGDPTRFAFTGLPVLSDPVKGQPGPLAGILAALHWGAGIGAAAVITVTVDTPFLPGDLATRLGAAAGGGAAIAASADAAGSLRRHPTVGLWPVALRDSLGEALQAGERKVMLWAERQGAGIAEFPALPFDPFLNINTPEDLSRAESLSVNPPSGPGRAG